MDHGLLWAVSIYVYEMLPVQMWSHRTVARTFVTCMNDNLHESDLFSCDVTECY